MHEANKPNAWKKLKPAELQGKALELLKPLGFDEGRVNVGFAGVTGTGKTSTMNGALKKLGCTDSGERGG